MAAACINSGTYHSLGLEKGLARGNILIILRNISLNIDIFQFIFKYSLEISLLVELGLRLLGHACSPDVDVLSRD